MHVDFGRRDIAPPSIVVNPAEKLRIQNLQARRTQNMKWLHGLKFRFLERPFFVASDDFLATSVSAEASGLSLRALFGVKRP
jgi:hypothetical protein